MGQKGQTYAFVNLVKAPQSSMQSIGSIVYSQFIFLLIDHKPALGNAVCNPAYHSSKVARV